MFIRKKKNRTGTISVHIIQKINGKQVHVKTIGYTSNPVDLKRLEAEAHRQIAAIKQQQILPLSFAEDDMQYSSFKIKHPIYTTSNLHTDFRKDV